MNVFSMRMTIVVEALVKGERIKYIANISIFYLKLKYIAGASGTKNVRKVNIILFLLFRSIFPTFFINKNIFWI